MQFDIVHKTTPTTQDLLTQIGKANTIIFVGGISPRLEGEEMKVMEPGFRGGDRTDIELPQAQRDIIQALHHAGKKIIFVNCSGSAIALVPELDNADAILQAWYPGEQGGNAVADILFGDYNPSGKLPITFYRQTSDLPDYENYHMKNRTYRYFLGNALFPFGFGLSYTTFDIKPKEIKDGKITVDITNTGKLAGTETVQLYIRRTDDIEGPLKTLKAYQRIFLMPGETKTIVLGDINSQALETWDTATNTMRFIKGEYELMIGNSSRNSDLKKYTMELK